MRVDLYIDGQLIDGIAPGEVVALTKQAAKWADFTTRSAEFSNTFTLARTAQLLQFFGHPDQLGGQSEKPYKRLPYELSVGGVPVSYGFAELEEVGEGVEVTLFSGLADFVDELGDITTADIDISDQNHRWNLTNIDNLRDRDADTGGIVYPDINYRRLHVTSPAITSADWLPAVFPFRFVKDALDAIGWRVQGFDKAWVFPFSQKEFIGRDVTLGKVERSTNQVFTNQQFYRVAFNSVVSDFYNIFGTGPGGYGMQAHYNGRYTFQIQLNLEISVNFASIIVVYVSDGVTFTTVDTINVASTASIQGVYDVNFDYTSPTGNVTAAFQDNIRIVLEVVGATTNNSITVGSGSFWEVVSHEGKTLGAPSPHTTGGGWVDCNNLIKPTKILDILVWNAWRTCSVLIADPELRELRYVALNDITKALPQDWTKYLDTTERPKIQYRLGDEFAQNNVFGYLPDPTENEPFPDRYEQQMEQGVLTVDDERLPQTSEAIKPFFVRSYFLTVGNTVPGLPVFNLVPSILRYSNPSASYLSPDIDPGQRMGRIEIISSRAKFIPDRWPDLLTQHYGTLATMLTRTKMMTANFWLPLSEFIEADVTRPVLVAGQLWYIRKINQYKVNEADLVEVELIRL
jgi:hypothetical protein